MELVTEHYTLVDSRGEGGGGGAMESMSGGNILFKSFE